MNQTPHTNQTLLEGIAAILTHDSLLEARRLGWKVIPDCSYVETYILRNPEFSDLLDA